ncbi:MAG TPA: hypothetical protein VJ253_03305 [Dehalococcoidia bacterium]|nr:hypothetical protein [Dehalococcoidia bacterium]
MRLFGGKLNALLLMTLAALLALGVLSAFADTAPPDPPGDTVTVGDGADDADDVDDEGAHEIAGVIAEAFGASADDVWAQHEQGIGFGALFKLYALGAPIPTDVDGEYEFNFGELRKALTEEQQAALEAGPKNLGQLIKAAHQSEGHGSDAANEAASTGLEEAREKFAAHAAEADGPQGHGPPESVPAHGRN